MMIQPSIIIMITNHNNGVYNDNDGCILSIDDDPWNQFSIIDHHYITTGNFYLMVTVEGLSPSTDHPLDAPDSVDGESSELLKHVEPPTVNSWIKIG